MRYELHKQSKVYFVLKNASNLELLFILTFARFEQPEVQYQSQCYLSSFILFLSVQASLHSGINLKECVKLPADEDLNDWVAVHSKLIITKCLSNNPTPCANNPYSVNCTTEEVLTLVILLQAFFVLLYVTIDRRLWFERWTMVSKLQTLLCDKFNTMQLIEVNSALIEQRTVLLSFNVVWLKPLKIIINYFRPPKIKLKNIQIHI